MTDNIVPEVKCGQIWMHNNKCKLYIVTGIANEGNSVGDDNNPPIINYMDGEGRKFARYLLRWRDSFTLKGKLQ